MVSGSRNQLLSISHKTREQYLYKYQWAIFHRETPQEEWQNRSKEFYLLASLKYVQFECKSFSEDFLVSVRDNAVHAKGAREALRRLFNTDDMKPFFHVKLEAPDKFFELGIVAKENQEVQINSNESYKADYWSVANRKSSVKILR